MLTIWQIVVINFAIFFGHYVIVATTLNFQYGNAGIPNMSNNLSVACGAYVITSVVTRICMWLLGMAGVVFRLNWVYDNPYNVSLISAFLETRPLLGFSLFLLSLALALVFGNLLGWVLASISGRMRASTLMVLLYVVAAIAMVAFGYDLGLYRIRRQFLTLALSLAFSVVFMLILDLDRPQAGLLRVSQQSMIELQERMGRADGARDLLR